MRNKTTFSSPFFLSIFLGIICWLFVFIISPVEVVFPISFKVVVFILLSYICMITGYLIVPKANYSKLPDQSIIWKPTIKTLILVVLLSFLIRYVDLFVFISYKNEIFLNFKFSEIGSIFIINEIKNTIIVSFISNNSFFIIFSGG